MTARSAHFDAPAVGPGVIWAFEFDEQGCCRSLQSDGPIDLRCGRRFVWVHLMLATVRSREWIGSNNDILPEARELLLSPDSHSAARMAG